MKKITKAFTLIELIVSMLIFGILMVGVMQLIAPIQNAATVSRVSNNQQTVENAISTFIGENVRYASNLVIIQQGVKVQANETGSSVTVNNAEDAIKAFFVFNPKKGSQFLDPTSAKNKGLVNVIAFDTSQNIAYRYPAGTPNQYTGRVISSIETKDASKKTKSRTTALNFANVTDFTGTAPQYEVFGNAYYGPADYYLTAKINDVAKTLDLQVSSKYYYSSSKKNYLESGDVNNRDNWGSNKRNATTASFELRNYRVSITDYVFKCITKNASAGACVTQHGDTNSTIYFVYTLDDTNNADKFDVVSDAPFTSPMVVGGTGKDITDIDSQNGTTVNKGESGGYANNNGTSSGSGDDKKQTSATTTEQTTTEKTTTEQTTTEKNTTEQTTTAPPNSETEQTTTTTTVTTAPPQDETEETTTTFFRNDHGPVTVEDVTINSGYVSENNGGTPGVVSASSNGSGTILMTVTGGYNDQSIQIKFDRDSNGKITVTNTSTDPNSNKWWVVQNEFGWLDCGKSTTISDEQLKKFQDKFGVTFN